MKSKALILTLFSIFLYSQNTESIAKMYCKCDVVISSNILQDNKIVFIGNETESFFAVNLTYNVIQKVNGQWIKKRKSKISFISNNLDESEKVNLDDFEFAQQNESFRTKDIEELLQIRSSRARKLISDLVTEGRLEALGENRNRRYQLIK